MTATARVMSMSLSPESTSRIWKRPVNRLRVDKRKPSRMAEARARYARCQSSRWKTVTSPTADEASHQAMRRLRSKWNDT